MKTFTINQAPYSIRCLMYASGNAPFENVAVCCHGFGGHKENGAMKRFAEHVLSRRKNVAVLCFDWPCHGEDVRRKLTLDDCDAYLRLVIDYANSKLGAEKLFLYATSFGGYLTLRYIAEYGDPFQAVALRCPAVNMYEVLTENIMTEENRALLSRGKDALVGFDRKIKLSPAFLDEVKQCDIAAIRFPDHTDDFLILHGTRDEIVPFQAVRSFAETNAIRFIPIPDADHRFMDPARMREAIQNITAFFALL